MCTPTQGVWQPAGCVSCEPVCVCVSLVRAVIICPASTQYRVGVQSEPDCSSPFYLPTYPPRAGPSRPAGSLPPAPGPPGLAPQPLIDQRKAQSEVFSSHNKAVNTTLCVNIRFLLAFAGVPCCVTLCDSGPGLCVYVNNYTPTRDIEQVVHTLRAMFKPTSVEPELGQGL